jgi:hypothetical protein
MSFVFLFTKSVSSGIPSINVVVPSYNSRILVFLISQCVYVCLKNNKYNFNSLKICFHYPFLHFGFKVFNGYLYLCIRRVWRYQRGNQHPYIEQTAQWSKEKSTKGQTTIYKTSTYNLKPSNANPTKTGCELWWRVDSS